MRHNSKTRVRTTRVALASLVSCSILLSACSSNSKSSSDSTSGGGATQSASSALSGTPVKIGLAVAESGSNASLYSDGASYAKVWQDYANAHGGVAGRPVQIVVRDSQSSPVGGLSAAKALVENDHVVAMMLLDTSAEPSIESYLASTDVPLLGLVLDAGIEGKRQNTYSLSTGVETILPGIMIAAKAAGKLTFGDVYCAEAPICSQISPIYEAAAPALGIKFVGGVGASASAPSYTAQCLQLMGKGVDFLELNLATAVAVRVAKACVQQGYKGVFGAATAGVNIKQLSTVTGATFTGELSGFPWWVDSAPVAEFRSAMKQYAPNLDYRTEVSTDVWSMLQVFKKALATTTGEISATTVSSAYNNNIKNETLNGLLPQPMTFAAGQPGPAVKCFWLYTYNGGDDNPSVVTALGTSGNGQNGPLATSCYP